jgi:hypothetical protein
MNILKKANKTAKATEKEGQCSVLPDNNKNICSYMGINMVPVPDQQCKSKNENDKLLFLKEVKLKIMTNL